jgi:hypothetical protein
VCVCVCVCVCVLGTCVCVRVCVFAAARDDGSPIDGGHRDKAALSHVFFVRTVQRRFVLDMESKQAPYPTEPKYVFDKVGVACSLGAIVAVLV